MRLDPGMARRSSFETVWKVVNKLTPFFLITKLSGWKKTSFVCSYFHCKVRRRNNPLHQIEILLFQITPTLSLLLNWKQQNTPIFGQNWTWWLLAQCAILAMSDVLRDFGRRIKNIHMCLDQRVYVGKVYRCLPTCKSWMSRDCHHEGLGWGTLISLTLKMITSFFSLKRASSLVHHYANSMPIS